MRFYEFKSKKRNRYKKLSRGPLITLLVGHGDSDSGDSGGAVEEDTINEIQGGLWRLMRSMVPRHWPDYVVKDLLYNIDLDPKKKIELVKFTLKDLPVRQWKLETRNLGFHSFDSETQRKILAREGGTLNPYAVPRDAERHQAQASIISRTGSPNQEPIIVVQRPGVDGLELLEGWHRTIQNIRAFPHGYRARAWVGYL